jgi:cell division protein FtsZ
MANPKRASMREGPLAALFRKTEGDGSEQLESAPIEDAATGAVKGSRAAATKAATTEAGNRERDAPGRRGAPVAKASAETPHPRESGLPHPALKASTDSAPDTRKDSVPTPRERLRHAFSSEIPENVMERSGRPVMDDYSREHPAATGVAGVAGQAGQPVIRVVGVGGAGVNAVNRMVEAEVEGVEFLAVNTDLQSLQQSTADVTLHIGAELTRGLGSGSDAEVGRAAAMEDYDRVKALLKGSDMIFITAGAGGGTGTGAAPIVARISRELGALTVAIVTKPFGFEGSRRGEQAERGIAALAEEVDTLIVVPNNRLLSVLDKQTAMVEAFRVADDVLRQGVQGISDLVTLPGLINLDFADVRTIMSSAGNALLGIGMGAGGDQRAVDAAMQAVSSPLLETSMEGARSILLSITGGRDLSLWEVNEAAKAVAEAAHPDANIIFGAMVDDKLDDQVWVTVVATGYGEQGRRNSVNRLNEPAGEPRVRRTSGGASRPPAPRRGGGLAVDELEVPEFLPNF